MPGTSLLTISPSSKANALSRRLLDESQVSSVSLVNGI